MEEKCQNKRFGKFSNATKEKKKKTVRQEIDQNLKSDTFSEKLKNTIQCIFIPKPYIYTF